MKHASYFREFATAEISVLRHVHTRYTGKGRVLKSYRTHPKLRGVVQIVPDTSIFLGKMSTLLFFTQSRAEYLRSYPGDNLYPGIAESVDTNTGKVLEVVLKIPKFEENSWGRTRSPQTSGGVETRVFYPSIESVYPTRSALEGYPTQI